MNIELQEIEQVNITIVYDRINLAQLSRDRLREMIPQAAPQLIDLPPAITLTFPEVGLLCAIDERRILCNDAGQKPVGDRPLATLAWEAARLVRDQSRLIAYGLNYDVLGRVEGIQNVRQFLTERFLSSWSELKDRLGATDIAAVPRLIFTIPPARYTVTLEPVSEQEDLFKAHLNVHFGKSELPIALELQSLLKDKYDLFGSILKEL